jgi:REP element-mobilizing transposase RayT
MARKLRIEYPGAIYHIINRGNYRRDLFETPGAGEAFLKALAEAVQRYEWRLFAYVLMRNHFHLAIETTKPNLVDGMHWLQSTVATRFNRFRQEHGHLFQGRYQSILVEDSSALARVVDYIHLNPVRARVVATEQLCNYRWSSIFRYLRGNQETGMTAQTWLKACGGWTDTTKGWAAYRKHLEDLSTDEAEQKQQGLEGLSKGWAIGTPAWRQTLAQEYAHQKLTVGMERAQVQELKLAVWETQLVTSLSRLGKSLDDLKTRPRSNEWKLLIAVELRSMGAQVSWIAEKLHLGKASSVRSLLSRIKSRINQQTAA